MEVGEEYRLQTSGHRVLILCTRTQISQIILLVSVKLKTVRTEERKGFEGQRKMWWLKRKLRGC